MVLEDLAKGILSFVNWGITIIVFMLFWEIFKWVGGSKAGEKMKEPFSKLVERGGIKGDWEMTKGRLKKLWRGEQKEEKFELKKYYSLKRLEKDLKDIHGASSDKELKDALGSDERKLKRDETRAYRRLQRLKSDIDKANLDAATKAKVDPILSEMEIYNNKVLVALKKFDNDLSRLEKNRANIENKKKTLLSSIREAIMAEQALLAEERKLNDLFK